MLQSSHHYKYLIGQPLVLPEAVDSLRHLCLDLLILMHNQNLDLDRIYCQEANRWPSTDC